MCTDGLARTGSFIVRQRVVLQGLRYATGPSEEHAEAAPGHNGAMQDLDRPYASAGIPHAFQPVVTLDGGDLHVSSEQHLEVENAGGNVSECMPPAASGLKVSGGCSSYGRLPHGEQIDQAAFGISMYPDGLHESAS
jgi:hypothetical protein